MIHIFDGAMGTMLHAAGLEPGRCPESWNIDFLEKVTTIHRQYVDSGADIIETNTLGANRIKLAHYGLSDKVALINNEAVKAARAACSPLTQIAGSVGPTGKFIAPLGDLSFDIAYDVFAEQIAALGAAGVDYIIIETIIDIQEMRAALLAAKTITNKPVICQLSFNADGRTITGSDACTAAVILEALGADVIGANCSLGPAQLLPIITTLARTVNLPLSVQPNAGMPELINGQTVFSMTPSELASWTPKLIDAGAMFLGGCCGTTPAHIKAMRQAAQHRQPVNKPDRQLPTALASRSRTIFLGPGYPVAVIGERINPTGRKELTDDIRENKFILVKREALAQISAGAHILDVNMGVPGIDQTFAMSHVINELSVLVDAPLAIDTTDSSVLEAGLRAFPGRALINSVSVEPERLNTFLPLAKKYGAAILCLPIAPEGVPATAAERLVLIKKIIDAGLEAGLRPQDFVLDALVMTVAANAQASVETLQTLKLYRQHFGYPATMGLSNISYGLPRRDLLNATFCAMAVSAGLDAPILNPADPLMHDVLASSAVLLGHDASGLSYSKTYAAVSPPLLSGAPRLRT